MRFTSLPEGSSSNPTLSTLLTLWRYIWPKEMPQIRLRVFIAIGCLVLSKISLLLVPLYFQKIIDSVEPTLTTSQLLPIGLIIAYVVARLLSVVFSEVRDGIFAYVTQRALRNVALNVFKHLHQLSLSYHLDRRTGGLSRSIERGTKAIESLMRFMVFLIVPTLLEILLVGGLLWALFDPIFAVVTVGTLVLYVAFTLALTEWRMAFVRQMNDTDNQANTKAIDSLLNYETVKYFGNEEFEAVRFDKSLKSYESSAIKSFTSLSLLNAGQALIIALATGLIMLFACQDVFDHTMTVGGLVAVNTYLLQLYIPLSNLGFAYREVKLSLVNMESMFSLLKEKIEVQDKQDAPSLNVSKAEITFENVDFNYHPDRPILKNVSFTVPSGKMVAIVGPSGAGKSTIARLLYRFYDVSGGAIKIDGQDIRDVTQYSLRQHIGVVPQDTVLFNETIGYNISYGRPSASLKDIELAAKQAHINDFIEKLPQKYDTPVGERGLKLSGGEKQRVAIARTFLKNPVIFLFDEATSALDTRTEKHIQANLDEISKNHTTVIIAHRLSTVINAYEIIVLEDGHVKERGDHATLLKQNGLYKKMWDRQQQTQVLEQELNKVQMDSDKKLSPK